MISRRVELAAGLGGAAVGVGSAVLEHAGPAGYLAGMIVGGALALGPRHPRAAWVTAALALAAAAPFGPVPTGAALVGVLVAFFAGREDLRWWAIAGLVALVAAL